VLALYHSKAAIIYSLSMNQPSPASSRKSRLSSTADGTRSPAQKVAQVDLDVQVNLDAHRECFDVDVTATAPSGAYAEAGPQGAG
jgi:hypothetical protein